MNWDVSYYIHTYKSLHIQKIELRWREGTGEHWRSLFPFWLIEKYSYPSCIPHEFRLENTVMHRVVHSPVAPDVEVAIWIQIWIARPIQSNIGFWFTKISQIITWIGLVSNHRYMFKYGSNCDNHYSIQIIGLFDNCCEELTPASLWQWGVGRCKF